MRDEGLHFARLAPAEWSVLTEVVFEEVAPYESLTLEVEARMPSRRRRRRPGSR